MPLRIPPGRAGRTWLRQRVASARNAADLLDHKRRELESELARLGTILTQQSDRWRQASANARLWLNRLDATAGARAFRIAAALESAVADARLEWRQVMGVRYPVDFDLVLPAAPAIALLDGGAALSVAIGAYRTATEAAVAHAVARTAHARVRAEYERTVRRLRALQLRAIPAHERHFARWTSHWMNETGRRASTRGGA